MLQVVEGAKRRYMVALAKVFDEGRLIKPSA
jgi:hypothetical protein